MANRTILIKRKKSNIIKVRDWNNNPIEDWVAYWRANPHRFLCDYLGLKFRDDFQSLLIYMMDRQYYFLFAASRGLAHVIN